MVWIRFRILCTFQDRILSTGPDYIYLILSRIYVLHENNKKIPKGVIRIRRSKKNRQHNGQMKKDKQTNNDQRNTTQIARYWARRIPLKTRGELGCTGLVSSSCSTSGKSIHLKFICIIDSRFKERWCLINIMSDILFF